MKKIILLLALFTATIVSAHTAAESGKAQKKDQKAQKKDVKKLEKATGIRQNVYIYGVAMSMHDSVVYVTDELVLNNVVVQKKNGFLENRAEYSAQLEKHLATKGERSRICSVTYGKTVKALDKKYVKQMAKLKKRGYLVKSVGQGDFRFVPVEE